MNLQMQSKNSLFNKIKYYLSILQLEEYDNSRYIFSINHIENAFLVGDKFKWTLRSSLVYLLALILFFLEKKSVVIANSILLPIEYILKTLIVQIARIKLNTFKDLKVLAIVGSYGKTTTKEMLTALISSKYKVLFTPGNINTPLGIAKVILSNLTKGTNWLIVELGEYKVGDISNLCKFVKPNYGIITGINEAHLERMGSIENTIKTMNEITEVKGIKVFVNRDSRFIENIKSSYSYSKQDVVNYHFNELLLSQSYELSGNKFQTCVLGEYMLGNTDLLLKIAKELDIEKSNAVKVIRDMKIIKHRLEPIHGANDTLVIDDSYNGNYEGFVEGVNLINKFKERRRVVITPGLVESGNEREKVHEKIGKLYGTGVDVVIIIKNSNTNFILKGLKESNFKDSNIYVFNNKEESYDALKNILKSKDIILFQNDWTPNYY
ncbi:MAG: Mur ligase family protein [bacterium]